MKMSRNEKREREKTLRKERETLVGFGSCSFQRRGPLDSDHPQHKNHSLCQIHRNPPSTNLTPTHLIFSPSNLQSNHFYPPSPIAIATHSSIPFPPSSSYSL